MVERSQNIDTVLMAIAHPVRRELLQKILAKDSRVTELAEGYDMTLAAVSKHIRVLENAGLLDRIREGKEFHFRARREPLDEVRQVLDELSAHWTSALDQLAILAEGPPKKKRKRKSNNENKRKN